MYSLVPSSLILVLKPAIFLVFLVAFWTTVKLKLSINFWPMIVAKIVEVTTIWCRLFDYQKSDSCASLSYKLTSHDLWPSFVTFHLTFDLHLWPLTSWTCEGSYIISINQVWFQLDFSFSNEVNSTLWAHLTTWPLMAFDIGIWPLTTWTNKGSHIVSNQGQSDPYVSFLLRSCSH